MMEFNIFFLSALFFNVVGHSLFTILSAHRTDVIPVWPELSTPELFFDLGNSLEDLLGGNTLHGLDDVLWKHHWYWLDEEVHMILVCPNLEEMEVIALSDGQAGLFDFELRNSFSI